MTITKDSSVSMLKALGIILMVSGHAYVCSPVEQIVGLFHMPLFFFASGYCFKIKYLDEAWTFCIRKIKTIWWPTVKWMTIFILLHNVFMWMGTYDDRTLLPGQMPYSIYSFSVMWEKIWNVVSKLQNEQPMIGGYWFMHQLWWGTLISYVFMRFIRNTKVVLLLLLAVCLYLKIVGEVDNYFNINSVSFLASSFIVAGRIFKEDLEHYVDVRVSIACFGLLVMSYFYWPTSMLSFDAMNVIPYFFSSLAGTIFFLWLFRKWKQPSFLHRVMDYIGSHTLIILTWHFTCFFFLNLLLVTFYQYDSYVASTFPTLLNRMFNSHERLSFLTDFPRWWGIVYILIGVAIPLAGQYVGNRCWTLICFYTNKGIKRWKTNSQS